MTIMNMVGGGASALSGGANTIYPLYGVEGMGKLSVPFYKSNGATPRYPVPLRNGSGFVFVDYDNQNIHHIYADSSIHDDVYPGELPYSNPKIWAAYQSDGKVNVCMQNISTNLWSVYQNNGEAWTLLGKGFGDNSMGGMTIIDDSNLILISGTSNSHVVDKYALSDGKWARTNRVELYYPDSLVWDDNGVYAFDRTTSTNSLNDAHYISNDFTVNESLGGIRYMASINGEIFGMNAQRSDMYRIEGGTISESVIPTMNGLQFRPNNTGNHYYDICKTDGVSYDGLDSGDASAGIYDNFRYPFSACYNTSSTYTLSMVSQTDEIPGDCVNIKQKGTYWLNT